nr:hypothetical protein [Tanacetum cinerariifolium]
MVKVFYKDFVPGNGSGVGRSGMLMEEEKIVKLVEEEKTADLELHVCGNVIDQGDLYKFDEEALDLLLEEEARESRAQKKLVRIIPSPVGIVQLAKIRKQSDIHEGGDDSVLSTQEYMKQVVEDVGEDENLNSGSWVGATEYVKANGGIVSGCLGDIKTFLKNGKLEQVVAIIKSCFSNALGDLKVTVKDLSGTLADLIRYKVINEESYGNEIIVGSAIIIANVLEFSPNPSMHYLNITKKNMIKVFYKDFVPGNGSGVSRSGMLMEEEKIVKLVEEEKTADLELHVCGNVIDQWDLYKFDEEALDLLLEEEARDSRAREEWLEKCRQQEEEDAKHERQLLGFYGTI